MSVSAAAARRFLVRRHLLAPARSQVGGLDGVRAVFDRLGSTLQPQERTAFEARSEAWALIFAVVYLGTETADPTGDPTIDPTMRRIGRVLLQRLQLG